LFLLLPEMGRADELRTWLAGEVLPKLVERPGVLGTHLVEGERSTSGTETVEKRLRGGENEFVDWVTLVGGYDAEVLASLRSDPFSEAALAGHGAASSRVRGVYRLVHCVTEADLSG
jgi:hypothetical protein